MRAHKPFSGATPGQRILIEETLATLPPAASTRVKADAMQALAKKLTALREFERWDPRHLESVVLKENYREVKRIEGHFGGLNCLQVLPDETIVAGGDDEEIRIWSKDDDESWSSEVLSGQNCRIYCLQATSDGRIISGGRSGDIHVWSKDDDGGWASEELRGHIDMVRCLQVLPDGRMVSGSNDRTIRIWNKNPDGSWGSAELCRDDGAVCCLQVLPDGRIVSGSDDHTIRIFDGEVVEGAVP